MASDTVPTLEELQAEVIHQRSHRCPGESLCRSSEGISDHTSEGILHQRVIVLRCGHVCRFTCLMQWFDHNHTCPICEQILFEGQLTADDRINLQRIMNLQQEQGYCARTGNHEDEKTFHDMWRKLDDQRAELFFKNKLQVDIGDYTVFREQCNPPLNFLPPEPRNLDAAALITKLDDLWDGFHKSAVNPITQPITSPPRPLTIPCHPTSSLLRAQFISTLTRLDGESITAKQLAHQLRLDFVNGDVYDKMRKLQSRRQAPQGFYIFQQFLFEAVLKRFVEFEEWRNPKRRPYGWVSR